MKKIITVLCMTAIFAMSGCSDYTRENADKLVEKYMEQSSAQQQEADESVHEPVYTLVDCDWDMYEELSGGNLVLRLYSLLKQAYTAYNTGSVPYGMLVSEVPGGYEWYYNYNSDNTLKFFVGNAYTVEMYYYNPDNISYKNNEIYTQALTMDICTAFDCTKDDLSISCNNDIETVSLQELTASYGIADNDLVSLKLTIEQ